MSHNENDPERSARKHKPAIIAIVVALVVAALAFIVFRPGMDEQGDGIATTPPPPDMPVTPAEGITDDGGPPVAPGADTPADAAPGEVGEQNPLN